MMRPHNSQEVSCLAGGGAACEAGKVVVLMRCLRPIQAGWHLQDASPVKCTPWNRLRRATGAAPLRESAEGASGVG